MSEKLALSYQGDWISFNWNKFGHSESRGGNFIFMVPCIVALY